jgi:hypothetical protein
MTLSLASLAGGQEQRVSHTFGFTIQVPLDAGRWDTPFDAPESPRGNRLSGKS